MARKNKDLEEEIRKYEQLIRTLDQEANDPNRRANRVHRGSKSGAGAGSGEVSSELLLARTEREKANKNLENLGKKWDNKVASIADAAQKMVSPN